MAERKRRPPSGKVKPGTPHPTKAHTVRGFDGRWVTRKSYNAAKKAREVAKKGGSLVKRASSAVTKASKGAMTKASKAGELLKIRKGDKGIVRAIKDTYKFGKDTRKSADAVYKAGKETRKVHDKLVKGGKEFVKGTVEAGKATRRVVENIKRGPGGKIVKSKGSQLTKYKKPRSGKLVKTRGKVVASQTANTSRDRVTAKGVRTGQPGKTRKLLEPKKVVTGKFKAPEVGKPLRKKTAAGRTAQRTAGQARQAARKTADKVRQTRAVSGLKGLGKDSLKARAGKTTKYLRGLRPKTLAGGLTKGAIAGLVQEGLTAGGNDLVDRGFRALSGKNKMSLKAFRAERDARLKAFKEGKLKPKAKSTTTTTKKPKVTRNKRGRVVTKNTPLTGGKELSSSIRNKQKQNQPKAQPIGTYKGGAKAKQIGTAKPGEGKVVPLNKKPFQNRVSGGSAKPKKKKVSVGNMIGATASVPKKKEAPKKKRMHAIEKRNREIHGDKAIDALKMKHKEWKKKRGRK